MQRTDYLELTLLSYTLTALLIGLFSGVHCLGMCGGIMGVLSASLPQEVRRNPVRLALYMLAYNGGRLAAYAAAGTLLGLLGGQLHATLSPSGGYFVMQLLAAVLMVCIGLYLAGWFPRFAHIERIGIPLWRRLEPFGRRLLPPRSPLQALLYGAIWGWLPCGLVYSALLLSLAAPGGAGGGALFMLGFGLGTLPAVVGVGMLSGQLALTRRPWPRRIAGMMLIALAVAGIAFSEQLHGLLPQPLQEQEQCLTPT